MTMKRNPRYWDQADARTSNLKFAIIPETNSRIATVVQGGATMMAGYPTSSARTPPHRGRPPRNPDPRHSTAPTSTSKAGVFTDRRAREAFYAAIDRPRLMQAYTQVSGYVTPDQLFHQGVALSTIPTDTLPTYNPQRRAGAVQPAGRDGKPFNIKLVTYTNSDLKRLGAYLQQVLTAYENVLVDLQIVDQAMLNPTCQRRPTSTSASMAACWFPMAPSRSLATCWRPAPGQLGPVQQPRYGQVLASANATMDAAAVKSAYTGVQKLVATEMPLYIFGDQTRSCYSATTPAAWCLRTAASCRSSSSTSARMLA